MKILGVMAAGTGILMAPLFYVGNQNVRKMKQTIKALDKTATEIFVSKEDCVEKGYPIEACDCSYQKAADIAGDLGTALSYSSEKECAENHGLYKESTVMLPIVQRVGNMNVTTYTHSTSYYPRVTAWQAEKDNICNAVPLYSTLSPTSAIRIDGKEFALRP